MKLFPPGFDEDHNNIAIDFDGVIHNFDKGYHDGTCYGDPLPNSINAIKQLSKIYKIIIKKSKKTGREFYKIALEDDTKQLYITIFNTRDIAGLNEGEFVCIPSSKNKFGFTKSKNSSIKKLI